MKGFINYDLGRNATIVIELAVGLAVGMAAQTARRAHAELERAARLAASLEERERLSRQVHDGAIQVLALVARRGREIGGETAELAELAGEQERALRRLVSAADAEPRTGAMADVGALLRRRASDRVSVSVPADPVLLDAAVADELFAAAANALDNVAAHAGPDARAYVLLEDLGDSVTVSIRDDGVGIADGRLEQAVDEGRVGIAKSIVGRMNWLGGSAKLNTGPGCGTEWELTSTPTVMVVDDHPIWRDAVARDLAEDGFDVVATADGVASARRRGRGRPARRRGDGHAAARRRRCAGDGGGARRVAVVAHPGALGVRRARRRAGGGEGRRDRLSRQECVEARTRRRGAGDGGGARGVHARAGRAGAGGVPANRAGPRRPVDAAPSLTERETEILRHVAKGLTAKQIAARLSLSHRTVENHVQATFRKLQVANRVELARYAIEHGLDE